MTARRPDCPVPDCKPAACDEVAGHYSAMACHISNMSYKEKRRVEWDKKWDV